MLDEDATERLEPIPTARWNLQDYFQLGAAIPSAQIDSVMIALSRVGIRPPIAVPP